MYKNFLLDLEPRRSICFHTLLQKYWGKWTESWICHYSFARGAVWFYQYYRYYYSSVVENILFQKLALLNCTLDYQIIMKFNLVIENKTHCILRNFRTFDMEMQDQKTHPMNMIYRVPKSKQVFLKNQILAV